MKYKFLEHTADIKFRAFGRNLDILFENIALAISEILSRGEKVEQSLKKEINIKSEDYESLLYDFIDELVYFLDTEQFLVSKAKVKIKGNELRATLYGDDALRYKGLENIKAATYSEMYIKNKDKFWEAQIVVDV